MQVDNETLDLIDSISNMLASYFVFGYYDVEDIEQEIRIMCLEALERYNSDKASLRTFLVINAKNRLINLQRKKMCKIFPPCTSCQYYENKNCNKHEDKTSCALYNRYQQNQQIKYNLLTLGELFDEDTYYNTNMFDELYNQELFDYIDKNIPAKNRKDYLQFIHGGKLSSYAKKNIVEVIRGLAEDYAN